jgi:hypothetical protein
LFDKPVCKELNVEHLIDLFATTPSPMRIISSLSRKVALEIDKELNAHVIGEMTFNHLAYIAIEE